MEQLCQSRVVVLLVMRVPVMTVQLQAQLAKAMDGAYHKLIDSKSARTLPPRKKFLLVNTLGGK